MACGGWITRSTAVWAFLMVLHVAAETDEVSPASGSGSEPAVLDDNNVNPAPLMPKTEELGTEELLKLISSLRHQPKWAVQEKKSNQLDLDTKNSGFKEPPTKRSGGDETPLLNTEGMVRRTKWLVIDGRVVEPQPLCLHKICLDPPPIDIVD